jgi:ABC-type transport system involved in cytochrome bd biosynthesis fused ATPase/permease subunit
MNKATTIEISLDDYYRFISIVGDKPSVDQEPIAAVMANVLLAVAKQDPTIENNLSFREKRQLRVPRGNTVKLVLGEQTMTALEKTLSCSNRQLVRLSRALLKEFLLMDAPTQQRLITLPR